MKIHANPTAAEGHTLQLESETLLPTFGPRESDPTARRYHPVPGQFVAALQRPDREPGSTREPGGFRHLTVGDHLPAWNLRDDSAQSSQGGQLSSLLWEKWYTATITIRFRRLTNRMAPDPAERGLVAFRSVGGSDLT